MISLGLTGNLGCGKSTVARLFAEAGAELVDADAIVHELLARGGGAAEAVRAAFPEAAGADGEVDRKRLAATVFADEESRLRLEGILHPLVVAENRRRLEELAAGGCELAVTEAALLFEAARAGTSGRGSLERFDAIVVVTCDESTQLERIVARAAAAGQPRAEAEEDARRRMAAQMPQAEKAATADWAIDNSGSLEQTRHGVEHVLGELRRRAEVSS